MPDRRPMEPEKPSDELLGQLAEEFSLLVRSDLELGAAEHGPQLRRLGVELAAGLAVTVAVVMAFAALSWAGVQGLALVMPTWRASLVVAAAWGSAAVLLLLFDHPRRFFRRLLGETSGQAVAGATRRRSDAEQALRTTAEQLARAVTREAAERELHAQMVGAERLMGSAEHEGEDLLKELVVALLAPGKAGLSVLESMLDMRRGRRGDQPPRTAGGAPSPPQPRRRSGPARSD